MRPKKKVAPKKRATRVRKVVVKKSIYSELAQVARVYHHTQQCRIELLKVVGKGRTPVFAREMIHVANVSEKDLYRRMHLALKEEEFWQHWLRDIKGIGPALGAALIGEIDISKAPHPSSLWAWWGVAPRNGRALPATQVSSYRKCRSDRIANQFLQHGTEPYVTHYNNYKQRKETTMVPICMACKGKGTFYGHECRNCGGSGGPAPWGMNGSHRDKAAKRYMLQRFLEDLWREWRQFEELPVAKNYAATYQPYNHPET
jgi:hypothetical protein